MVKGSYHFEIGDFKCLFINDSTIFVPDHPRQESTKSSDEDQQGRFMNVICLFVNTGKHKILIDTGCGDMFQSTSGELTQKLKLEGISCAEIDMVIHTHGHPDHIGGSFDVKGNVVFHNARYLVSDTELRYWVANRDKIQIQRIFGDALKNCPSILERFESAQNNSEILPGIKLTEAPGHTPGNIVLEISSGNQQLLCIGDIVHTELEFSNPDLYSFIDALPEQAMRTRHQVLSHAAKSGKLAFVCHLPFPGIGHIVQKDNQLTWQPVK